MRPFFLFGVWSCISVCSRLAEVPAPAEDDSGVPCTVDCPAETGDTDPGTGTATRAIIVVMDGARYDETFRDEYSDAAAQEGDTLFTHFKEHMLPMGTLVRPGYNTGVTITAPGHADILTGTRNFFAHFPAPGGAGYYRPEYPTLFEAASQRWPGNVGSLVANSDHLQPLNLSVFPGATEADGGLFTMVYESDGSEVPSEDDSAVLEELKTQVLANQSHIALANLHQMDRAGHYNPAALSYAQDVEKMSEPISAFWDWIQAEDTLRDTTLLVVVADHGRHRWEDEAAERGEDLRFDWDYSEHGDQCGGCREIPMFLVGPGIRQGIVLETPNSLEDIGATVAYALGLELPHATGAVMRGVFVDDPGEVSRTGTAWFDTKSGHQVQSLWTADESIRSDIYVDGIQLAGGVGARILAEDPVVYQAMSGAVIACWRELDLAGTANPIDMPWVPLCHVDSGSGFTDMLFPVVEVFPFWRPSITETSDGTLVLAFADNENSNAYSTSRGGIGLYHWSEASGWTGSSDERAGGLFVGNPSVVELGGKIYVANAESDMGFGGGEESSTPGRYTRHVSVKQVSGSATLDWTELWRTYTEECPELANCAPSEATLDDQGLAWGRAEFPSLTTLGAGLAVAWVSWGAAGVTVHVATSDADATTWSTPERVDESGLVLGHIEPAWGEGRLYWARQVDAGGTEVCRWTPGAAAVCIDTASTALRDLSVDGEAVTVLAFDGTRTWSEIPLSW